MTRKKEYLTEKEKQTIKKYRENHKEKLKELAIIYS